VASLVLAWLYRSLACLACVLRARPPSLIPHTCAYPPPRTPPIPFPFTSARLPSHSAAAPKGKVAPGTSAAAASPPAPTGAAAHSDAFLSRAAGGTCFDFQTHATADKNMSAARPLWEGRKRGRYCERRTNVSVFFTLTAAFPVILCGFSCDLYRAAPRSYLVGTEDGAIHKCSRSYPEYLENYLGHSGPVYRLRWSSPCCPAACGGDGGLPPGDGRRFTCCLLMLRLSRPTNPAAPVSCRSPFCPEFFLSCSADWTAQLWHSEHDEAPMFVFQTFKVGLPIAPCVLSPPVAMQDKGKHRGIWARARTPLQGLAFDPLRRRSSHGEHSGQVRCSWPSQGTKQHTLKSNHCWWRRGRERTVGSAL